MKSSGIMGLLVVMACASGGASSTNNGVGNVGGGDQDANVRHVTIGNVALQADARSGSLTAWTEVPASFSKTWQALPVAYHKLGLTITRYDSTAHIIEGERLRSHREFGGKQLGALMDCGDVAGMPNVTRFDVNIQVRTAVRGSASASSVASAVVATAKPSDVSGVLMPCVVNSAAAERVAAAVVDAAAAK
jgi:hypothetical protein